MNGLIYVTVVRKGEKKNTKKDYCLCSGDPEYAVLDAEETAKFRKYMRRLGKQGFALKSVEASSFRNYEGNHVIDYKLTVVTSDVHLFGWYSPGYQYTLYKTGTNKVSGIWVRRGFDWDWVPANANRRAGA